MVKILSGAARYQRALGVPPGPVGPAPDPGPHQWKGYGAKSARTPLQLDASPDALSAV